MEEQFITFETAKLAKEKGCKNSLGLTPLAFDCTQTFLQKWLREVHNIHIEIRTFGEKDIYPIFIYEIISLTDYLSALKNELSNISLSYEDILTKSYKTYELALEAALQEALKLI